MSEEKKDISVPSLIAEIDRLEDARNRILSNHGADLHNEIFQMLDKGIFQEYPFVDNVGWPQYTPYFNDGDPCNFSANLDEYHIRVNGMTADDGAGTDLDDFVEETGCPNLKVLDEITEKASKILYSISETILESVYGEGLIVIRRDGSYRVKDYRHD